MANGKRAEHTSPIRKALTAMGRRVPPRIVHIAPLLREREAARVASDGRCQCAKCGSTFVVREPAFIHCRYCGAMSRIPEGSLLEQQLFELRSGLRLAS